MGRQRARKEDDIWALDPNPNRDDMATDLLTQPDGETIEDAIADLSGVDATGLESTEATRTTEETETSHAFKYAQDSDKSLDCYRTRARNGSREFDSLY